MPIAWVHQLPATFEGRARMMVANALAAAGGGARRRRAPARHPPGPPVVHHVDLPGARPAEPVRPRRREGASSTTRTTRAGWRRSATSCERMTSLAAGGASRASPRGRRTSRGGRRHRRGTGATRTCGSSGRVAARYFDEIIVREDANPRGRQPRRDRRADHGRRPGGHRTRAPAPATSRSCSTRWRRRAGRSTGAGPATWSCCASTTRPRCGRSSSAAVAGPARILLRAEGNGRSRRPAGTPTSSSSTPARSPRAVRPPRSPLARAPAPAAPADERARATAASRRPASSHAKISGR